MERDEFAKHIGQLQVPLRKYLLSMCGNASIADDLTQETLIMAWQNAETFSGRSTLLTWVCRIGYHYLHKRVSASPITQAIDNSALQIPDPDDADTQFLRQALHKAIESLSPLEREAIQLYYDEDKNMRQIAEIIETPQSTAKSLIWRGRNKLKKIMRKL